jgi:phosphoglycerate dehydrogenase-like enzyme
MRVTSGMHLGCSLLLPVGTVNSVQTLKVKLLASFGMKQPITFDPYCSEATAAAAGVKLVSLDELMENADFVSVHCPLNDATKGLIGKDQFAKIKTGSYLLNTARGGIVDEDALAEALSSGKLAGAALDCFAAEPVLEPQPLTKRPGFVAAPHCIGYGAAFCGRNLHSRMPLDPTHVRLKRTRV